MSRLISGIAESECQARVSSDNQGEPSASRPAPVNNQGEPSTSRPAPVDAVAQIHQMTTPGAVDIVNASAILHAPINLHIPQDPHPDTQRAWDADNWDAWQDFVDTLPDPSSLPASIALGLDPLPDSHADPFLMLSVPVPATLFHDGANMGDPLPLLPIPATLGHDAGSVGENAPSLPCLPIPARHLDDAATTLDSLSRPPIYPAAHRNDTGTIRGSAPLVTQAWAVSPALPALSSTPITATTSALNLPSVPTGTGATVAAGPTLVPVLSILPSTPVEATASSPVLPNMPAGTGGYTAPALTIAPTPPSAHATVRNAAPIPPVPLSTPGGNEASGNLTSDLPSVSGETSPPVPKGGRSKAGAADRKRKANVVDENVDSPAAEGQRSRRKLALPAHLEQGGYQPPKKGTRKKTAQSVSQAGSLTAK
jgi:hypothetical protein